MMKFKTRSVRAFFVASGLLAAFAIYGGCGSQNPATGPGAPAARGRANAPAPVTVTIPQGAAGMGTDAFGQNPLSVPQGTTVTWTNGDSVAHTSTSDAGSAETWDSGTLQPGQTFSHTFNTPGTFPYHCSIHGAASMSGTIDVTPAAQPSGTPSGAPTTGPTTAPTTGPTAQPAPTTQPMPMPTVEPYPTNQPTVVPTTGPKYGY